MAPGYVAITKSISWQGGTEEFSNVYWLDDFPTLAEADGLAAIDSLVALERLVHSDAVTFVRAVCYRKGGLAGLEGLAMREYASLKGTAGVGGGTLYRECAILVKFELPRSGVSGFGRFRQLMKWLHVGAPVGGLLTAQLDGSQPLSAAQRDFFANTYANPLMNGTHGPGRLSNADGDRPHTVQVHPYVEHRQFHQGRKER